jgi:hypothetical protein
LSAWITIITYKHILLMFIVFNSLIVCNNVTIGVIQESTNRFTWVTWWRAPIVREYSATAIRRGVSCSHPTILGCTRETWRAITRSDSIAYRTVTKHSYPSRSRTADWCRSRRIGPIPKAPIQSLSNERYLHDIMLPYTKHNTHVYTRIYAE